MTNRENWQKQESDFPTVETLKGVMLDIIERMKQYDSSVLSDYSGVHYTLISGIVKGRQKSPNIFTLVRIATALDILDDLVANGGNPKDITFARYKKMFAVHGADDE